LAFALILPFLKIIASSITLGFGDSNGIFVVSFLIGARIEIASGLLINNFLPKRKFK